MGAGPFDAQKSRGCKHRPPPGWSSRIKLDRFRVALELVAPGLAPNKVGFGALIHFVGDQDLAGRCGGLGAGGGVEAPEDPAAEAASPGFGNASFCSCLASLAFQAYTFPS